MSTLEVNMDSYAKILDVFLAAGMEGIRAGKVGDTILTFFPTSAHLARPSFLEVNMSESLLSGLRQAIQFVVHQRPDSARYVSRMTDLVLTLLELQSMFRKNATVGEHYMGLGADFRGPWTEFSSADRRCYGSRLDAVFFNGPAIS